MTYFAPMGLRQEKFARQVQRDLSEIFQLHRHNWLSGEFVTISGVQASPDLGHIKVYVSLYNASKKDQVLQNLELYGKEIRKELARRLKNQVKKIPELAFYEDDSLDYMNRIDAVFEKIRKPDSPGDKDSSDE